MEPVPRNTRSDKQAVSFRDPGGSNSEDGDDLNTLVTMTKAEQVTTPGGRSRQRRRARRRQAPRHPDTQPAGITQPWASRRGLEPRKRRGRGGSWEVPLGRWERRKHGSLRIRGVARYGPAKQRASHLCQPAMWGPEALASLPGSVPGAWQGPKNYFQQIFSQ